MTYVLSSVVQKGGVGKTLCTANLGYVLSQMGYKVLMIDGDSQNTLSALCNLLPKEYNSNDDFELFGLQDIFEYYLECEKAQVPMDFKVIKKAICRPKFRKLNTRKTNGWEEKEFGFDLIGSDIGLANYEQILTKSGNQGGLALYKIVKVLVSSEQWDFILIDCPPSLTTLSYNGLSSVAAATNGNGGILVPINLEISTLRGARNLIRATGEIQELLWNMGILHKGILGLIKNEYVERFRIQQDFEAIVNDFFPVKPFKTAIPKKTSCDVAHKMGMLYAQYDKTAYNAFESLAKEIIKQLKKNEAMKEPNIVTELGSSAMNDLFKNSVKINENSKN